MGMFYMIGKILQNNNKTILLENNYIGYTIFVSKPESFEVGKIKKIFLVESSTINQKNRIVTEMYGFDNINEKNFFFKLLGINGIGHKTALTICAHDTNLIKNLVKNKDFNTLQTMKGINAKIANSLINELELEDDFQSNNPNLSDLTNALKTLGYSSNDIEFAIKKKYDVDSDISIMISDAIKYIVNKDNGCQNV